MVKKEAYNDIIDPENLRICGIGEPDSSFMLF